MGSIYKRKMRLSDGSYQELPTLWIQYSQHGRVVRESTGTTNTVTARRMLRTREGDVEKGIPISPKMGRITFEEAADDLVKDYQTNSKRSIRDTERRIDKLRPTFRGRRLIGITTTDVRAYVAARLGTGAANATVNRELSALKRMFSLAIQAGTLYAKPHIPMLREDNTRKGFFELDDLNAVCRHLPEAEAAIVRFAYITGWRVRSEILGLEWRQVDWAGRVVRLDPGQTKNREGRTFPFTAALEALLTNQRVLADQLRASGRLVPSVFHRDGKPVRTFRRSWITACLRSGIPGRLLHDFRRTAVRNLERAGVSRSAAMAMVGHKTESIYRRYAIVDAGALRDAAARLDRTFGIQAASSR